MRATEHNLHQKEIKPMENMKALKKEMCDAIMNSYDYTAISLLHRIMIEPALGFFEDEEGEGKEKAC